MCNKSDNSCRQEKLGCKGCKYYNVEVLQSTIESLKGHKHFIYTNEDKIQAIEQVIYENMYLLDIRNLYEDKIKHYVQIIEKLYKENRELKEITNNYDVICKNDADYILIANKSYFDNGIFKDNLISKNKIKKTNISN